MTADPARLAADGTRPMRAVGGDVADPPDGRNAPAPVPSFSTFTITVEVPTDHVSLSEADVLATLVGITEAQAELFESAIIADRREEPLAWLGLSL